MIAPPVVAPTHPKVRNIHGMAEGFTTEALRLEELLADHGVAVRVGPARVCEDTLRFPLQLGLGATTRHVLGLSGILAREAGYPRCHVRRESQGLVLELPRARGAVVRYGDLLALAGVVPIDSVILGLTDQGTPLTWRVTAAEQGHFLVVGDAGTGKSSLLRLVAIGLMAHHAPRFWRFAFLASRHAEIFIPLSSLPHKWAWSEQPESTLGWLVRLQAEMLERERAERVWPRVLVLLDEIETVLAAGGELLNDILRVLLTRGANAGIHLMITSRDRACVSALLPFFPVKSKPLRDETNPVGRFAWYCDGEVVPFTSGWLDEDEVRHAVHCIKGAAVRLVAQPVS